MGEPRESRIWRSLRRLLPAEWRERHGDDVLQVHVELVGGAGNADGIAFWLRVARDVVLTSLQVRLDARGRRDRSGWFDGLATSARLAVRSLVRTPAFALAVIGILGLGIAANATMFRVLDRVLLSPPPGIAEPASLYRLNVYGMSIFTGVVGYNASLTHPDYLQLETVEALDGLAGFGARELTMKADGRGERVRVEFATASYFPLLGVRPVAGRFYREDEDRVGAATHVMVLSHAFWQRRFGGEADVIGRELEIGKGRYTVVGVAPAGFTGVDLAPVDAWLPLRSGTEVESGTQWVDAFGWYMMAAVARVAPDRVAAAEASATRAYRAAREDRRGFDAESRIALTPLIAARGPNASRESRVARLLALLAVLVLLITCANVGNLFLARVLQRRREISVQAALGVSRGRLFLQLFLEIGLLAGTSALLALGLSRVAGRALFRTLLPDAAIPETSDLRVAGATVALAFLTAGITAVLPVLHAARADVMDTLRRARTTTTSRGARRALLMAQAALSVTLLVGAGLFIRSLRTADTLDIGLDRSALIADVELDGGIAFGEDLNRVVRQSLQEVRASPAVESAAATSLGPMSGWWGLSLRFPNGDSLSLGSEGPWVYGVTGDYFASLGMKIVRGRPITDADDVPGAARVAVVSERLAGTVWPDADPIGQCILPERDRETCTTVIGVVGDAHHRVTDDVAPLIYYVPTHHPSLDAATAFIIRPRAGADITAIRDDVLAAVPGASYVRAVSIEDRLAPQLRPWRLGASLLTAFGALALLIAAAGLYSTLAFDLAQRRRELGVRAALGASAARLVQSVVAGNLATVAIGAAIGLLLAIALGQAAQAMLFRVDAADPLVFAGVIASLLVVGILASAGPAWGATRVEPAKTLREE